MIERNPPPPLRKFPGMTSWYGPKALTQTGYRDYVSRVIGGYADQRILQAAVDDVGEEALVKRYDYSRIHLGNPGQATGADAGVWIDYLADTGDGFDPTYAMASLLTKSSLDVAGLDEPLPGGEILLMGGDQAYPYAARDVYKDRLIEPFDMTVWYAAKDCPRRKVFLLPGNHDWYDGLSSFDSLFCNLRDGVSPAQTIGNYECHQHRSYWAIRLPHDWWIWGLDIQLTESLDVGQTQYFSTISAQLSRDNAEAKIILCIAQPSWHEGARAGTFETYSANLQTILNLAIDKARVCVVMAGDLHHYSRYFNSEHRLNLITCGGGGAYLAPTHQLKPDIDVPWKTSLKAPLQLLRFTLNAPISTDDETVANHANASRPEAAYPKRHDSSRLSWPILGFPLWNPGFCLGMGFLFFLMYWIYTSTEVRPLCGYASSSAVRPFCPAASSKTRVALDEVVELAEPTLNPLEHLYYVFEASRWQPLLGFILIAVFALIYFFLAADRRRPVRLAESAIFWIFQVLLMAYMTDFVLSFSHGTLRLDGIWQVVVTSLTMLLVGGAISGFLCGIYLFYSTRLKRAYTDIGFSSVRYTGHKCFIRMHITKDELTIYPIGLDKVPRRSGWRKSTSDERARGVVSAFVPRKPLIPRLIEGPITIRPADIKDLD